MRQHFHQASIQYAIALWLATVLALLIAFVVQLEPAQWAGITVWIMFMQTPRLNYSKVIWWVFGTVVGALTAIVLIALFNQAPDLMLGALALVLGLWAGAATLVKSYKAYGFVLAGYTCAIVAMSAVERPELVFQLAVTRVSCIFIGMASAIFMMRVWLPRHDHWKETVHHLNEHLKATLAQAGQALRPAPGLHHFTWRHMVDRLSTLEHTLDITTAESPESRLRAAQARSLVATLFCLLAKAQSIELHLKRRGEAQLPGPEFELLEDAAAVLTAFAETASPDVAELKADRACAELGRLREEAARVRESMADAHSDEAMSNRFILERVDEILVEAMAAVQDWAGLFGPWKARRSACLDKHHDYRTAFIFGLRMVLGMGLVSAIWFITQWPSGSQLVLFMAVVCSLLSLVDYAPAMGMAFLKSAVFCFTIAFVESFWLLQMGEGFLFLAIALGLFLVPAAYAYRHPRLTGSAVVSMLIFYGLTMPANQMNYDISAFLNNGQALLGAACCGFFMFHAVPSMTPATRRFRVLGAVRGDLAQAKMGSGPLAEQSWTSRMFDRLRVLHQGNIKTAESLSQENEALIGLQLGLRQIRLRELIHVKGVAGDIKAALHTFSEIHDRPDSVAQSLRLICTGLHKRVRTSGEKLAAGHFEALAEMREMIFLIEAVTPLYVD